MPSVNPRTTKSGTVYDLRFSIAGKSRQRTFTTRADADRWHAVMESHGAVAGLRALDLAELAEKPAPTVAEMIEAQISTRTGVRTRTTSDYRRIAAKHIVPQLGSLPASSVDETVMARWVNGLDAAGLSGKTIANARGLLSAALSRAVREGHLRHNPAGDVRLPRDDHEAKSMRVLTSGEAAALVHAISPHYRPLILFLLGTGMRWSEATALQRRHLDLESRLATARVQQAWERQPDNSFTIGPAKTRKSIRTVTLANNIASLMVDHCEGLADDALVFTTKVHGAKGGGRIDHGSFYKDHWVPSLRRAGLTGLRIHDLRHTCASWLLGAGVDVKTVQEQLGHEKATTTLDTYGHAMPGNKGLVADVLALGLAMALPEIEEPTMGEIEA